MQNENNTKKSVVREQLKTCKEKVRNMMSPYLREDKGKGNVGALKYLKNLFICTVAMSSKSRKGLPAFQKFVEDNFLTVDEEVLSYFDSKKNMEAFRVWKKELLYSMAYNENFGFPPFLLLQKARMVKDEAMVRYLELGNIDEDYKGEEIGKARERKLDAYLKWLQSIAFLEICVREYSDEIQQAILYGDEEKEEYDLKQEEVKRRIETMDQVYLSMNAEQVQRWEQETIDLFSAYMERVNKLYYRSYFYLYAIEAMVDLFASLRVLILIEYVNVNGVVREGIDSRGIMLRDSNYRIAYEEARFWEKTVNQWLQDENGVGFAKCCFVIMDYWNRNHASKIKEFNKVARRVYPLKNNAKAGKLEEQVYFHDALKEYISILEKQYDKGSGNLSQEQRLRKLEEMAQEEPKLLEIKKQLAGPIWSEMDKTTERTP